MIISASRRSDIPMYYSKWFENRINDGYVITKNPLNLSQVSKINLTADVVDLIVFWTKDPLNIMEYLLKLDNKGYKYYFNFTITPYDKSIERNLRDKNDIEKTFIDLSNQIGKDKVNLRYDPILLNENIDINYHKHHFERLCKKLHKYTNNITFSFIDMYKKIRKSALRELSADEMSCIGEFIGSCGKEYGVNINTCCEKVDFSNFSIGKATCIDRKQIEGILSCPLNIKQDKNQRDGCNCVQSVDIGMYNTCVNGCTYCYANYSPMVCEKNFLNHNPDSEILIGEITDYSLIKDKVLCSNKIN